jgi:hypothetical protein
LHFQQLTSDFGPFPLPSNQNNQSEINPDRGKPVVFQYLNQMQFSAHFAGRNSQTIENTPGARAAACPKGLIRLKTVDLSSGFQRFQK